MEKILNDIIEGIKKDHDIRTAQKTEAFLRERMAEYAEKFGLSEHDLLEAIEKDRDYCAVNFYQEANFPSLDGVMIFEDWEEMKKSIPNKKFRCPACNGISTNPYECNSGKEIEKGKVCDWKTYGLFRTAGKGIRFTFKKTFLKQPKIDEIFMPVDFEEHDATGE